MIITPKNWSEFQHYKDRSPPWIKLHRALLDNHEYHRLSPEAAKYLPLIWIIASEKDGLVPAGAELAFRLRIEEPLANDIVVELMGSGFLVEGNSETAEQTATRAQRIAKTNGFGNRHISDEVKRLVWKRDEGKCCSCGSQENVEYDHKHPVSKGGNSEKENIQLLCRPCNRRKRTKLATPAQPLRSLEKERETEVEREKEKECAIAPFDPSTSERDLFSRGKQVLGKTSGGLIAKLKIAKGGNISLARSALEMAATKENPAEYIAAIIRGPPAKPLTEFQRGRRETQEILNDLDRYANGGGSGEEDLRILPGDTGFGPEGIRGGTGGIVVALPSGGRSSRE